MKCLYCPAPGDSLEHPLPAAFGEFRDAPYLENRSCKPCNNKRLGVLDEQLTRCGPEALFRKFYGIHGRRTHESVNIFLRGSAGGKRVDLRSMDNALGIEVALEIEDGQGRQLCQSSFSKSQERRITYRYAKAAHPMSCSLPIIDSVSSIRVKTCACSSGRTKRSGWKP